MISPTAGAARVAVRRAGSGDGSTVRLGITPPVAPVLLPHLVGLFALDAPDVAVGVQRMWLPLLTQAIADGTVDVAITCGLVQGSTGIASEVVCAELLLVGLRTTHRLAGRAHVSLDELATDVFGATQNNLFPAWALCQEQAFDTARIKPPAIELHDVDLVARRWPEQEDVEWIMLTSSLVQDERSDVVVPVKPEVLVPTHCCGCPGTYPPPPWRASCTLR